MAKPAGSSTPATGYGPPRAAIRYPAAAGDNASRSPPGPPGSNPPLRSIICRSWKPLHSRTKTTSRSATLSSITRSSNRLTGALPQSAYPQLSGSLGATYYPNIPVQAFPNFIAQATYGVLTQEGVKNGSGQPIQSPADFGLITAGFGTQMECHRIDQLLADLIRRPGIRRSSGKKNLARLCPQYDRGHQRNDKDQYI